MIFFPNAIELSAHPGLDGSFHVIKILPHRVMVQIMLLDVGSV